MEAIRRGRLRWFGHVERKEVDDWVSACRNLEVARSRGRGRPRMTRRTRLDGDMKDMGLSPFLFSGFLLRSALQIFSKNPLLRNATIPRTMHKENMLLCCMI